MTTTPVQDLTIGTVILPPARDLRLWMRRMCAEKGKPESAAQLIVRDLRDGAPDKNGAWAIIVAEPVREWGTPTRWAIKARPSTPWPVVATP